MTSFKRIYHKAAHGDKTRVANSRGCSLEYISKLTRIGGDHCPAEHYIAWLAQWADANPAIADQIHEHSSELYREMRSERIDASFEAAGTASEIAQRAADAITALLDGEISASDEEALLRLASTAQQALSRIRGAQSVRTIEISGGWKR